jgi:hypothetical protein
VSRIHIALRGYATEEETVVVSIAETTLAELRALPKRGGHLHHVVVIDCPDCGRTLAYDGACRKCAGRSWLPAGRIDRIAIRRLIDASSAIVSEDGDRG